MNYGICLLKRPLIDGLTKTDVEKLINMMDITKEVYPLELVGLDNSVMGFITQDAAEVFGYDYEMSGLQEFINDILEDYEIEKEESNEYEFKGVKMWMGEEFPNNESNDDPEHYYSMKDIIQWSFEDFLDIKKASYGRYVEDFEKIPILDWKYAWLCEYIFDVTTYDTTMYIKYGKIILEVLTAIRDGKTFDYIKDNDNYNKFLITCNLFMQHKLLNWGTSIRGCWFEFYSYDFDFTFIRCSMIHDYKDGKEVVVRQSDYVDWSEEVVNYLIDVFFKEVIG